MENVARAPKRLGAKATVIEMLPTIVPFADRQVAKALEKALTKQGLAFRLKSRVAGAVVEGDRINVTVENEKEEKETISCDRLLVAVGRRPLTEGAGLEEAGVKLDESGRIEVDDRLQTDVPGVYAIGDVTCKTVRQAVIAAAEGCIAGLSASRYVSGRERQRPQWS